MEATYGSIDGCSTLSLSMLMSHKGVRTPVGGDHLTTSISWCQNASSSLIHAYIQDLSLLLTRIELTNCSLRNIQIRLPLRICTGCRSTAIGR